MEPIKTNFSKVILVCTADRDCDKTCCTSRGKPLEIYRKLKEYIVNNKLYFDIRLSKTGCLGICEGPVVAIYPDNIIYKNVTADDVDKIIEVHLT